MQRFVGMLVILLAGLSLLVSTEAYQTARPTSAGMVSVASTDQAGLRIEAGANNVALGSPVSIVNGKLQLDMGFDDNSTNTLNRVIKITNTNAAGPSIRVTVTPSDNSVTIPNGYLGGGTLTSNFSLPPGQFIDLNLTVNAGTADAAITFTVQGQ